MSYPKGGTQNLKLSLFLHFSIYTVLSITLIRGAGKYGAQTKFFVLLVCAAHLHCCIVVGSGN